VRHCPVINTSVVPVISRKIVTTVKRRGCEGGSQLSWAKWDYHTLLETILGCEVEKAHRREGLIMVGVHHWAVPAVDTG
jgi:hypothetical protein